MTEATPASPGSGRPFPVMFIHGLWIHASSWSPWEELFAGIAGAQDAVKDKPCREHVDYALNHAGISADAQRLIAGDVNDAITRDVIPAYQRLAKFLGNEYLPKSRSIPGPEPAALFFGGR